MQGDLRANFCYLGPRSVDKEEQRRVSFLTAGYAGPRHWSWRRCLLMDDHWSPEKVGSTGRLCCKPCATPLLPYSSSLMGGTSYQLVPHSHTSQARAAAISLFVTREPRSMQTETRRSAISALSSKLALPFKR